MVTFGRRSRSCDRRRVSLCDEDCDDERLCRRLAGLLAAAAFGGFAAWELSFSAFVVPAGGFSSGWRSFLCLSLSLEGLSAGLSVLCLSDLRLRLPFDEDLELLDEPEDEDPEEPDELDDLDELPDEDPLDDRLRLLFSSLTTLALPVGCTLSLFFGCFGDCRFELDDVRLGFEALWVSAAGRGSCTIFDCCFASLGAAGCCAGA